MTHKALRIIGKHHTPGHISLPPPQFLADEITNATHAKANRYQGRHKVEHLAGPQLDRPGIEEHRHYHAQQTAVKGHSSFPYLE